MSHCLFQCYKFELNARCFGQIVGVCVAINSQYKCIICVFVLIFLWYRISLITNYFLRFLSSISSIWFSGLMISLDAFHPIYTPRIKHVVSEVYQHNLNFHFNVVFNDSTIDSIDKVVWHFPIEHQTFHCLCTIKEKYLIYWLANR